MHYEPAIKQALEDEYISSLLRTETYAEPGLTAQCLHQILSQVREWTDAKAGVDGWAIQLHLKNLRRLQGQLQWEKVKLNFCAMFCLTDYPQHALLCRHAICDSCVSRLGSLQAGQEYRYRIKKCSLCSTPSDLEIILKPPTAGLRILSLDGGGVRGVVLLQLLKQLESTMGPDVRIQDFFDLCVGTSAGVSFLLVHSECRHVDTDVCRCARRVGHAPSAVGYRTVYRRLLRLRHSPLQTHREQPLATMPHAALRTLSGR